MSILKRSTAAKIEVALAELASMASETAKLQQRRDAELAGDGDTNVIATLDRQRDDLDRLSRATQDKIAFLQHKAADEEREQSKRDYVAWCAKVEATLPACREADAEYERAKLVYGAAIKKVILSREAALRVYAEGTLQPETVFVAYYLGVELLAHDIADTWTIPRGHADRRPAQPREYLTRARDIGSRGYLPAMRERLDQFIAHCKAPDPAPIETEATEAA